MIKKNSAKEQRDPTRRKSNIIVVILRPSSYIALIVEQSVPVYFELLLASLLCIATSLFKVAVPLLSPRVCFFGCLSHDQH